MGSCSGSESITSIGNKIEATTNYVGGCIGESRGTSRNARSGNNIISGNNYVGGCIGISSERIRNAKTYYDSPTSEINIVGNNYVGGIVGQETYNVSDTNTSYFSIIGVYIYNANILGNSNVGGIAGDSRGTVSSAVVDNSIINASNDNAGGILGYYKPSTDTTPSKINEKSCFYLSHSFCTNSQVMANNNAGGLVGNFVYGDIQYCYVGDTTVTAITKNAGGLVGYLNNKDMTDKQYIAKMRYNFIANPENNSIVSATGVGGLIGTIYAELLPGYIHNNLVVTDLECGTTFVSMGIGEIETDNKLGVTQSSNMDEIYVYDCSYINQEYLNDEENEAYNLLTSEDLADPSTYTNSDGLNFVDSAKRYSFETGYFPILRSLQTGVVQTYWGSQYLDVQQEKISTPTRVKGSEIVSTFSLNRNRLLTASVFPEIYVYAVDVDKINIEFNTTNPYTYFDIKTNDTVILERTQLQERVYTLQYDFNTPIEITVSNLENWYTKEITGEEIRNKLDIVDNEYLYISDNTLYSNKKDINGEFVNLYNGKALSTKGEIFNVSSMEHIENTDAQIKLLDIQTPISEAEYNGITIKTFYHCSKVIQDEENYSYKDQQIFIKNSSMYVVDGDLDSIGNAITIDSYNNKQYETILGTDGILYDLLTEINYPANFKNENIIGMTNNINNNENIVLVYYSSGKVYGFNYITGEEVFDNNIGDENISLWNYLQSSLKFEDLMYDIEESGYVESQELIEKLEHTSIDEAIEKINIENSEQQEEQGIKNDINEETIIQEDEKDNNTPNLNTTSNEEYITTYNTKTKAHVVYSASELLSTETEQTKSENDKINEDTELISYYTNMSTSKINLKNIGIIIFSIILTLICIILVVMHKKNNRENR